MKDYTTAQAAELLNCSEWTVRRLIASRRLRAYDIGSGRTRQYRIQPEAIDEFRDEAGTVDRRYSRPPIHVGETWLHKWRKARA
jgi:excisionase family DNA binding protein